MANDGLYNLSKCYAQDSSLSSKQAHGVGIINSFEETEAQ